LEIARKNATKLMRKGVLPSDIFSKDQIFAIRAGGKSVEELTDYCKRLAKKDASGVAISDDDGSGDEMGEHFLHHPFHVKDRPLPQITLNIRNAVPIPSTSYFLYFIKICFFGFYVNLYFFYDYYSSNTSRICN
jgi:hypothetical protein